MSLLKYLQAVWHLKVFFLFHIFPAVLLNNYLV